jgi:hypothetical protein
MVSGPGGQAENGGDASQGTKRRRTDATGAAQAHGDACGPSVAGGSAAGVAAWAPLLESRPSATAVQPEASARDWVAQPSPFMYCELCHNVFSGEVRWQLPLSLFWEVLEATHAAGASPGDHPPPPPTPTHPAPLDVLTRHVRVLPAS